MKRALAACVSGFFALGLSAPISAMSSSQRPPEGEPDLVASELVLEGVVIASEPSFSIALLRRQGARRARPVRVGETAFGMTLVAVSEQMALFELNGKELRLVLGAGRRGADTPAAELGGTGGDLASSGTSHADPLSDIDVESEGWVRRQFERTEMRDRLNEEMPLILAQTGLAARIEEGEVRGLQITHLPDGTLLSDVGLMSGDVLLSINEVPMDGLATLAGLYPRLESEDEIRVVLERGGRVLRFAYEVH